MSTGSRLERARCRGFTLVELLVSLGVLVLLSLIVERTLASTHEAERYVHAVRRVTEQGQLVSYEVANTIGESRRLFQRDAVGLGYLGALDLAVAPPAAGARLPLIDELRPLGKDEPGDPRTGNVLLFVREGDPAPCVVDAGTGATRYVDTYRFVCIYPHLADRRVVSGPDMALDLVVWRSKAYPARAQLLALEAGARVHVVRDLYHRYGYRYVWDAGAGADAAFYALDAVGNIAAGATPGFRVEEDRVVSDRGRLVYANLQLARTDPDSPQRRAVLTVEPVATWAPNGFEVKVAGPSGARKVWMRLAIEAEARRGSSAVHAGSLIASVKDM
jgi:prepilin-type N-terminal cleavage/methylation domain-containing protein